MFVTIFMLVLVVAFVAFIVDPMREAPRDPDMSTSNTYADGDGDG